VVKWGWIIMTDLKLGIVEFSWGIVFQLVNTILIIGIIYGIFYLVFRLPKRINERDRKIDRLEEKIDELNKKIDGGL